MLIHLTALFSQASESSISLIIFDEPETSLHPYAISVFAEAVKLATKEWNKQVFIATHSPVLISQFDPEDLLATGLDESWSDSFNASQRDGRYSEICWKNYAVRDHSTWLKQLPHKVVSYGSSEKDE